MQRVDAPPQQSNRKDRLRVSGFVEESTADPSDLGRPFERLYLIIGIRQHALSTIRNNELSANLNSIVVRQISNSLCPCSGSRVPHSTRRVVRRVGWETTKVSLGPLSRSQCPDNLRRDSGDPASRLFHSVLAANQGCPRPERALCVRREISQNVSSSSLSSSLCCRAGTGPTNLNASLRNRIIGLIRKSRVERGIEPC